MTLFIARETRRMRAWNRPRHLKAGLRLCTNPVDAFFLAGKALPARFHQQDGRDVEIALTPEAEAAAWITEAKLACLTMSVEDDVAESDRYLSATERLRRLEQLRKYFCEFRVRLTRKPILGIVVPLDLPLIHVSNPILDAIDPPRDMSAWLKADNDNEPHEEGERRQAPNIQSRIRPGYRDADLLPLIALAGPTVERRHARRGGGGEEHVRPVDVSKTNGVIVRAGKLRIGTGKTYIGKHRVEAGTILHQEDRFGETLGPKRGKREREEAERSNMYFRRLMSFDPATGTHAVSVGRFEFKKAGKVRRQVLMTAEERAGLLAGPLPPITYCPPGLPCGGPRLADNFLGGWASATKGAQPPERWQDLADDIARQEEFKLWWKQLPADERLALKTAMKRPTLRAVGEAFGKEGKAAERVGTKFLHAANQNLKKFRAEVSIPTLRAA